MTLAAFIERSRREKEDWRYTDLESLLAAPRAAANANPPAPAAEDAPRLVFVNGAFAPQQSRFGAAPSCILMGDLETGYRLTLGQQTCLVAQPIEMVFAADGDAPREIAIRLAIEIGESGRLTLLERHLASASVTTFETGVTLHPRAKFLHKKMIAGGAYLSRLRAHVAGGAYYNNFSLIRGAQPARNEIDVELAGEEAQTVLNGLMLLRGAEHADTTTRIRHSAPNCASRQVYKTVLDGKARGVFQGKIIVAEGAQKTDGYQLSRALLLSDQAEMDARPELEINADDVKCSHGSTIGDLDDDALFYLRARGIGEAQARAMLVEAFVAEMIDEIRTEQWRDFFRAEVEGWSK